MSDFIKNSLSNFFTRVKRGFNKVFLSIVEPDDTDYTTELDLSLNIDNPSLITLDKRNSIVRAPQSVNVPLYDKKSDISRKSKNTLTSYYRNISKQENKKEQIESKSHSGSFSSFDKEKSKDTSNLNKKRINDVSFSDIDQYRKNDLGVKMKNEKKNDFNIIIKSETAIKRNMNKSYFDEIKAKTNEKILKEYENRKLILQAFNSNNTVKLNTFFKDFRNIENTTPIFYTQDSLCKSSNYNTLSFNQAPEKESSDNAVIGNKNSLGISTSKTNDLKEIKFSAPSNPVEVKDLNFGFANKPVIFGSGPNIKSDEGIKTQIKADIALNDAFKENKEVNPSSLFVNKETEVKPSSLFGNKEIEVKPSSLFGNKETEVKPSSLFGNKETEVKSVSLFGELKSAPLFGTKETEVKTVPLFGTKETEVKAAPLFETKETELKPFKSMIPIENKVGLFSAKLFQSDSNTLKSNESLFGSLQNNSNLFNFNSSDKNKEITESNARSGLFSGDNDK